MLERSEFYTAYTPYQPEVSQAVLSLYSIPDHDLRKHHGMDAANASMYDSASAAAESVTIASDLRGEDRARFATVHP